MKQAVSLSLLLILYIIVTPGFHCGPGPVDNCTTYKTDTALMHFSVTNPAIFHINDTIRLASNISDTLNVPGGNSFIYSFNTLHANINLYKVAYNGAAAYLNYANNEFNVIVQTGSFQNMGGTGFQILYNRIQPYSIMNAALVPGHTGLYLITVNMNIYSPGYDLDIYNSTDRCTNYKGIANIPLIQQQRQYWDSIGTTTLTLANSTYSYVNKNNRNYFFIKVI